MAARIVPTLARRVSRPSWTPLASLMASSRTRVRPATAQQKLMNDRRREMSNEDEYRVMMARRISLAAMEHFVMEGSLSARVTKGSCKRIVEA